MLTGITSSALSVAIKEDVVELGASMGSISNSIAQLSTAHKQVTEPLFNEKKQAALEWLSSASFASKQTDTFSMSQEGTGKWFLEEEMFKAWCEGDNRVLCCQGIRKTLLQGL